MPRYNGLLTRNNVQLNDTTTATEYTQDADLSLRRVCHRSVKLLIEYIYQRLSKQGNEEPSLVQFAVFRSVAPDDSL